MEKWSDAVLTLPKSGFRQRRLRRSSKSSHRRFFSTFDMDKLAKILQHRWKECLKISKIAWFESDLLKTKEAPYKRM